MIIILDELTSEGRTVEMGSAEAKPIMVWGRSSSVAMVRRNIGEVEDVLVMVTLVMMTLALVTLVMETLARSVERSCCCTQNSLKSPITPVALLVPVCKCFL